MLIFIPVISACIGWFASRIAIKMLFHPRDPVKILGMTFQGIFPKRQQQIAIKLGKFITSELLSFSEIEQKIADPANVEKILPLLETHIDTFLRKKLPTEIPMLGMLIGDKTISQVKSVFMKELKQLFPLLMRESMTVLQQDFNLQKIINEKARRFSSDKLEKIVNRIMSTEFKFIEITGAVLGFIIGLIQVVISIVTIK